MMANDATLLMGKKRAVIEPQFIVPQHIIMPLWLRSLESLFDEGLVYDPMAASVCSQCAFGGECNTQQLSIRQLLHNAITHLTDKAVSDFLIRHPSGWIVNLSSGLDTRFYRLDNGRCRWLELDTSESLIWRQRLLHKNERFYPRAANLTDLGWIKNISIPDSSKVLVICDHALLSFSAPQVTALISQLGRHFRHAEAALVLAGDRCDSRLSVNLGSEPYNHGFVQPAQALTRCIPWAEVVSQQSPLEIACPRWPKWYRWLALRERGRYLPSLFKLTW